jgi:Uma2 family endonuclease
MESSMMTVAIGSRLLTFEQYLDHDDGTDTRYELVNGELVEMPTESPKNCHIAKLLMIEMAKYLPILLIYVKDIEIVVSDRRKVRMPDLAVLSLDGLAALRGQSRNMVTGDMPAPLLVVEVVSPGQENRDRDYRYKRTEYAARGVNEYWIIDPDLEQIMICLWVNGQYEDTIYIGDTKIISTVVNGFDLTVDDILAFGQK